MEKIFGTHSEALAFGKSLNVQFEIGRHENLAIDGDPRKGFSITVAVPSFSNAVIAKYRNLGVRNLAYVVNEKTHSEHWFA